MQILSSLPRKQAGFLHPQSDLKALLPNASPDQFTVRFGLSDTELAKKRRLFQAIRTGNYAEVKKLVPSQISPNATLKQDGTTALMAAGEARKFKIFQYLLKQGADSNAVDKEGYTPWMRMSPGRGRDKYNTRYFDELKKYNASINAQNRYGETVFHLQLEYSVDPEWRDAVHLVKLGANFLIPGKEQGNTALHLAAKYNATPVLEAILASPEVNPNPVNVYQQTPIMVAAEMLNLEAFNQFIKHPNTQLDLPDEEGLTVYGQVRLQIHFMESQAKENPSGLTEEGWWEPYSILSEMEQQLKALNVPLTQAI